MKSKLLILASIWFTKVVRIIWNLRFNIPFHRACTSCDVQSEFRCRTTLKYLSNWILKRGITVVLWLSYSSSSPHVCMRQFTPCLCASVHTKNVCVSSPNACVRQFTPCMCASVHPMCVCVSAHCVCASVHPMCVCVSAGYQFTLPTSDLIILPDNSLQREIRVLIAGNNCMLIWTICILIFVNINILYTNKLNLLPNKVSSSIADRLWAD